MQKNKYKPKESAAWQPHKPATFSFILTSGIDQHISPDLPEACSRPRIQIIIDVAGGFLPRRRHFLSPQHRQHFTVSAVVVL